MVFGGELGGDAVQWETLPHPLLIRLPPDGAVRCDPCSGKGAAGAGGAARAQLGKPALLAASPQQHAHSLPPP